MIAPKFRCAKCEREGIRGYTYTIKGVYVCTNKNACNLRQHKPLYQVRQR